VKAVLMDPATTKTVVALGGESIGVEVVDATCEILTAAARLRARHRGPLHREPDGDDPLRRDDARAHGATTTELARAVLDGPR